MIRLQLHLRLLGYAPIGFPEEVIHYSRQSKKKLKWHRLHFEYIFITSLYYEFTRLDLQ